jgi:predicted aspartyl protease
MEKSTAMLAWGIARGYTLMAMGLTHVTVTLTAFGPGGGSYQADFLVDTGATDSLAPAAELRKIGVQPVGKMVYELYEYEFGLAQFEFMGEITAGRVIFGPDDAEPILGVTVLESVASPLTLPHARSSASPLSP